MSRAGLPFAEQREVAYLATNYWAAQGVELRDIEDRLSVTTFLCPDLSLAEIAAVVAQSLTDPSYPLRLRG